MQGISDERDLMTKRDTKLSTILIHHHVQKKKKIQKKQIELTTVTVFTVRPKLGTSKIEQLVKRCTHLIEKLHSGKILSGVDTYRICTYSHFFHSETESQCQ